MRKNQVNHSRFVPFADMQGSRQLENFERNMRRSGDDQRALLDQIQRLHRESKNALIEVVLYEGSNTQVLGVQPLLIWDETRHLHPGLFAGNAGKDIKKRSRSRSYTNLRADYDGLIYLFSAPSLHSDEMLLAKQGFRPLSDVGIHSKELAVYAELEEDVDLIAGVQLPIVSELGGHHDHRQIAKDVTIGVHAKFLGTEFGGFRRERPANENDPE